MSGEHGLGAYPPAHGKPSTRAHYRRGHRRSGRSRLPEARRHRAAGLRGLRAHRRRRRLLPDRAERAAGPRGPRARRGAAAAGRHSRRPLPQPPRPGDRLVRTARADPRRETSDAATSTASCATQPTSAGSPSAQPVGPRDVSVAGREVCRDVRGRHAPRWATSSWAPTAPPRACGRGRSRRRAGAPKTPEMSLHRGLLRARPPSTVLFWRDATRLTFMVGPRYQLGYSRNDQWPVAVAVPLPTGPAKGRDRDPLDVVRGAARAHARAIRGLERAGERLIRGTAEWLRTPIDDVPHLSAWHKGPGGSLATWRTP